MLRQIAGPTSRGMPVARLPAGIFLLSCLMLNTAWSGSGVEFVPKTGVSDTEGKTIEQAAAIAQTVIGSACFGSFLRQRRLIETQGRSAAEVALHLQNLSGKINVDFYYRCMRGSPACTEPTTAIAYRQPPDETIHLNRAYYDIDRPGFDIYEMAGSIAHEAFGHSLGGYQHPFDWTSTRDFTVPYSISGASTGNSDAFQHCRAELGYGPTRQSLEVLR